MVRRSFQAQQSFSGDSARSLITQASTAEVPAARRVVEAPQAAFVAPPPLRPAPVPTTAPEGRLRNPLSGFSTPRESSPWPASWDKRPDDGGRPKQRNRRAPPREASTGAAAYPTRGTLEHMTSMGPWAKDNDQTRVDDEARAFGIEAKRDAGPAPSVSPRSGAGPVPPPPPPPAEQPAAAAEQPAAAAEQGWDRVGPETRIQRKRIVPGAPLDGARELVQQSHAAAELPHEPAVVDHYQETATGGAPAEGEAPFMAWLPPDAPSDAIMCGGVKLGTRGKQYEHIATESMTERELMDRRGKVGLESKPEPEHRQFVTLNTASSVKAGEAGHYQKQRLLPLPSYRRDAQPTDAILDSSAQSTSPGRARPLFDRRRVVPHETGGELGLTNPAHPLRREETWHEKKLFDTKGKGTGRPPPSGPSATPQRRPLRRAASFERPTASSARREQQLFDRKRAVALAKAGRDNAAALLMQPMAF